MNKADIKEYGNAYFERKQMLKVLQKRLRELLEDSGLYPEIQALKKKLKSIQEAQQDEPEIQEIKQKIKDEKESNKLLKDILRVRMIEDGQMELELDGGRLNLIHKVEEVK